MRANRRTPCGDPDDWPLWTSEDPADRAEAATRCRPCPLLALCAAVVLEEQPTFGAWAGRDIPKRK